MSLATRCPACGTVFRVVSDQLKVSEGWVRCGRCAEVFNAAQRLFDLEQDAAAGPLVAPPPRPLAEVHRLPLRDPGAAVARVGAALAPPSTLAQPEAQQVAPESVPVQAPAEAEEPSEQPAAAAAETPSEATSEIVPADRIDAAPAAEPAGPAPTPEFVRRADRAARWRQPARRGPLAALALLLRGTAGGTDRTALPRPPGGSLARHPAVAAGRLQRAGLPHRGTASHRQPACRQQRPGACAGQRIAPAVAGAAEQGADHRAHAGHRPGADRRPRPDAWRAAC